MLQSIARFTTPQSCRYEGNSLSPISYGKKFPVLKAVTSIQKNQTLLDPMAITAEYSVSVNKYEPESELKQ